METVSSARAATCRGRRSQQPIGSAQVRLGKAAGMGQEKKDAEFDKLMKAMESLVKAELRQAALEAAL